MKTAIIQKIHQAPKAPGVYIFYKKHTPLYVGKAASLRLRLKNYLKPADYKTEALNKEADSVRLITLHSNIEALIIESRLIKKLNPRYNILWRDDKNYFYVAITKEKFPRIFITHQPIKIPSVKIQISNENQNLKTKNNRHWDFGFSNLDLRCIGPFTDGASLKTVLRLLRRQFPYCTCQPHRRICLNSQINNCPGYCCNQNLQPTISQIKTYQKNIRKITAVLTGKDKRFLKTLKDPYELLILDKIWAHQPYLNVIPNTKIQISNETQSSKSKGNKSLDFRFSHLDFLTVECYDNSHLSGKEAVGAMTAWQEVNGIWEPNKTLWRKFKMRGSYTENDPRMMHEIISRRLNHPEWPYPDYIIIDGGITQLRAAQRAVDEWRIRNQELRIMNKESDDKKPVIHNSSFKIPKVIAFPKPQQRIIGMENPPQSIINLAPRAIAETHNFVIRYHRKLRNQSFRQ